MPLRPRRLATLALVLASLVGCLPAQSPGTGSATVFKTSPRNEPLEVYGHNPNPPVEIPAIPIGADVIVPAGRAAMTLYVSLPGAGARQRQAQFVAFGAIKKVAVTVVGENLANPAKTTVDLQASNTAAASIIIPAGRNQIVTAIGMDSEGKEIATVKGVATSVAGSVVDVSVRFGTTPLASVIGALDGAAAPAVSAGAIAGVIDPVLGAKAVGSRVEYAKHPVFVDVAAIVMAVKNLLTASKDPAALTTQEISAELARLDRSPPVLQGGSVKIRVLDPDGVPAALPGAGIVDNAPWDGDGDGVPDGAILYTRLQAMGNREFAFVDSLLLDDLVSGYDSYGERRYASIRGNASPPGNGETVIAGDVPPGEHKLSYYSGIVSTSPWIVMKTYGPVPVAVKAGEVTVIDLRLVDVTKQAPITSSGGSIRSADQFQWYTFPTAANVLYRIKFGKEGPTPDPSSVDITLPKDDKDLRVSVRDQDGFVLFRAGGEAGEYAYASPAANTLRLYVPRPGTPIEIATEPLSDASGALRAGIDYGR